MTDPRPRFARARAGLLLACVPLLAAAFVALGLVSSDLAAALGKPPQTAFAERRMATDSRATGTLSPRTLPIRANLVGASWKGSATRLELRARGADRRWSRWVALVAEPDEAPDATSHEARAMHGRSAATQPVWVGDADTVQVRIPRAAHASDIRLTAINSTGTATVSARMATALRRSASQVLGAGDAAASSQPAIITRAQWGADESVRRDEPSYAPSVKGAVVHHTVSANSYAKADSAALVRGIYQYHVRSMGWDDIGYNFLVDRYGQVFEGRYGGTTQPVIGAHTSGFNTSTSGMALLGTHGTTTPTAAARGALTRLIAWRLDRAHADPTGTMRLTSAGNVKYSAGTVVTKRAVSGHRDLYLTECPGSLAYGIIDPIRSAAWQDGSPKFADPAAVVSTAADGKVSGATFTAHGNTSLQYTLTVRRASDKAVVTSLVQSGTDLNLQWNGASALGSFYGSELEWVLEARTAATVATPATQPLTSVPPPVELQVARQPLALITPNADGLSDSFAGAFRLNTPAPIRFDILDRDQGGRVVRTVWTGRQHRAGEHAWAYDSLLSSGAALPDGRYTARLRATDPVPGREGDELSFDFAVDRTLSFAPLYAWSSPNGDGVADVATIAVGVQTPSAVVQAVVRSGATVVRTLHSGAANNSTLSLAFDGRSATGQPLPDGLYSIELRTVTARGTVVLSRALRLDRGAPRASAVRLKSGLVRIRSSEPAIARAKVRLRGRIVWRGAVVGPRWLTSARLKGALVIHVRDAAGNTRRVRVR